MLSHQQKIVYCLKQYTHASWLAEVNYVRLNNQSSGLLWNLAYADLCSCFSIEMHAPDSTNTNELRALSEFIEVKDRIIDLMVLCLDGSQYNNSYHPNDILYCAQVSQALSLKERFEQHRNLYSEKDNKILAEFLCYCFFKNYYPNIFSRIKIQFQLGYIKTFNNRCKKMSVSDVRVISHLYKSLTHYLCGSP
jgi:hypothetical protein